MTKTVAIIVFCLSFVLMTTVAFAALTLTSTTISSEGDLILAPASKVTVNGDLSVSGITELPDAEKAYWQDKAALLDPDAYEFFSGTGWSIIVPEGETWYSLSQYQTQSAGQQQKHQRLGDVEQAIMLPAGTTIAPTQNSFMYIAKPSLVINGDSRYQSDPKGLYYTRLNRLRGLAINSLSVAVPGTLATGATVTADFPADFTKGLLVSVSAYEISWGGMQFMQNGVATGAVNLQNELNNYHSIRFAQGIKYPFNRTIMPGIMAAAGNREGTAASTSLGGGFLVEYVKLPSDW